MDILTQYWRMRKEVPNSYWTVYLWPFLGLLGGQAASSFGTALRVEAVRAKLEHVMLRPQLPLVRTLGHIANAADAGRHLSSQLVQEATQLAISSLHAMDDNAVGYLAKVTEGSNARGGSRSVAVGTDVPLQAIERFSLSLDDECFARDDDGEGHSTSASGDVRSLDDSESCIDDVPSEHASLARIAYDESFATEKILERYADGSRNVTQGHALGRVAASQQRIDLACHSPKLQGARTWLDINAVCASEVQMGVEQIHEAASDSVTTERFSWADEYEKLTEELYAQPAEEGPTKQCSSRQCAMLDGLTGVDTLEQARQERDLLHFLPSVVKVSDHLAKLASAMACHGNQDVLTKLVSRLIHEHSIEGESTACKLRNLAAMQVSLLRNHDKVIRALEYQSASPFENPDSCVCSQQLTSRHKKS